MSHESVGVIIIFIGIFIYLFICYLYFPFWPLFLAFIIILFKISYISHADKRHTLLLHLQIISCAVSTSPLLIVIKQSIAAFVVTVHFKTSN